MSIKRIKLEKFTVFDRLEMRPCRGLNVLIGVNGSGKSHLMKALYAAVKPFELPGPTLTSRATMEERIAGKLAGVFRPDDGRLGRLVSRRRGVDFASVLIEGTEGKISFDFGTRNDQPLALSQGSWAAGKDGRAIFLPSREVLSIYEGFLHALENRELAFDETYSDLCLALSASPLKGPKAEIARTLLEPVNRALGGHPTRKDDRFYVKLGKANTEAHLVAEGLRKLASISFLISTGSLTKGGLLFWDEPEANLNPRLIAQVADLLLTLVENGMQIFIATHDYLLAHRLSLFGERRPSEMRERLRFFSLHQEKPGEPFQAEAGATLATIEHNTLLDEFARFYDEELETFEGVGRAHRR